MIKSILGGKSKNLFDKNNAQIIDGYISGINVFSGSNLDKTIIVPCLPNTTYTFSKISVSPVVCDRLRIGDYTAIPAIGDTINNVVNIGEPPTQNYITITTSDTAKYIVVTIGLFKPIVITSLDYILSTCQLELGSTATEYVPHELTSYKSIMKVSDVCQLVAPKYIHTIVDRGVTFTNNGDGSITVNGTPTGEYYSVGTIALNIESIKHNHKYVVYDVKKDPIISELIIANYQGGYIYKGIGNIFTFPEHPYTRFVFEIRVNLNQTANNIVVRPQLFDLTEMFGAGNEPKTVAEFKAKFPNDYYPYSPSCFVTSYDERMPCKTKNLFSSSTEVGIPSSTKFDKSEKRLLENGKWYIGLAGSNYYSQNEVLDYSIMENSVYVKWKGNGYAVAKCIYCEPNTTYSFTKKYSLIQGLSLGVYVVFYTEDGTFISFKSETASPRFVFTTPENCKYIAICLSGTKFPNDNFGAGCFSDLQLVKGTTATDYVPFGYV